MKNKNQRKLQNNIEKFDQELVVINILFLEILEKTSLILHIVAMIAGVLSLVGLGFHIDHNIEIAFEATTIFVVFLIVLWAFLKPYIKRMILKNKLKFIWGNKKVKTKLSTIEQISVGKSKNNGDLISIIDQKDYISLQNIWMGFNKKWKLYERFVYKIELNGTWKEILSEGIEDSENRKLLATIIPSFILLDMKEKTVELTAKNTLIYSEDNILLESITVPIVFKINYETKEMNWSGTLPNNPTHGNWEIIEEEIIENE